MLYFAVFSKLNLLTQSSDAQREIASINVTWYIWVIISSRSGREVFREILGKDRSYNLETIVLVCESEPRIVILLPSLEGKMSSTPE